jgi:hypothetical protein
MVRGKSMSKTAAVILTATLSAFIACALPVHAQNTAPIDLAPTADGQGATLAVDVAEPGWVGKTISAVKNNPVKTAGALLAGYAVVRASQGKLDDDLKAIKFWDHDADPERDPKGFKEGVERLGVPPPGTGSYQEYIVARDGVALVTSSSLDVQIKSEFGSSGSSRHVVQVGSGLFEDEE